MYNIIYLSVRIPIYYIILYTYYVRAYIVIYFTNNLWATVIVVPIKIIDNITR